MRKWIVTGLLAMIGIAVLAYAILETRPGSVGYHKWRYRAAKTQMADMRKSGYELSLLDRAKATYSRVTGKPLSIDTHEKYVAEMKRMKAKLSAHEQALIQLGYMAKERFVLRNRPTEAVQAFYMEHPPNDFLSVERPEPNFLVITALRSEMASISEIVARIDERAR